MEENKKTPLDRSELKTASGGAKDQVCYECKRCHHVWYEDEEKHPSVCPVCEAIGAHRVS